jgi:hypothetical protein
MKTSMRQLRKYFTFEVMVLDDKNVRRRFRASNYQVSSLPNYGRIRSYADTINLVNNKS